MSLRAVCHRLASPVVLVFTCALAAGCAESEGEADQTNLRLLSLFYSQYRAEHRGALPANEEEFKNYIVAKAGDGLAEAGIASVDELFISSRDGKPFVVKYRGDKSWPLPEAIAYEQEGRGGVRHVASLLGGTVEMSDEEFRNAQAPGVAK